MIKQLEFAVHELLAVDMAPLSVNDACKHFRSMRLLADFISEQNRALAERIDEARQSLLPQKFREAEVSSIAVAGYRYTISETVRASIKDKAKGLEWLRSNDRGGLVTETVNASSLAAEARRMMEAGEELPQDLFNVALLPNVSMTKT